jgi:hypothetical protein
MEEKEIDGVVDVVDARDVEAQVAKEQGHVSVSSDLWVSILEMLASLSICLAYAYWKDELIRNFNMRLGILVHL